MFLCELPLSFSYFSNPWIKAYLTPFLQVAHSKLSCPKPNNYTLHTKLLSSKVLARFFPTNRLSRRGWTKWCNLVRQNIGHLTQQQKVANLNVYQDFKPWNFGGSHGHFVHWTKKENCTNCKTCHPQIVWSYYLQIVEESES